MSYTYSSPKWWANIYLWNVPTNNRKGVAKVVLGKGRSGSDIIKFQVNNNIKTMSTLTLDIVPNRSINYLSLISVSSVVEFFISTDSGYTYSDPGSGKLQKPSIEQQFIGFVEKVSFIESIDATGKPTRLIRVACSGPQKAFMKQAVA